MSVKSSAELRSIVESVVIVIEWANTLNVTHPLHYFAWDGRVFRIERFGGYNLSYSSQTGNYNFQSIDIRWEKLPTVNQLVEAVLKVTERLNTEIVVEG